MSNTFYIVNNDGADGLDILSLIGYGFSVNFPSRQKEKTIHIA